MKNLNVVLVSFAVLLLVSCQVKTNTDKVFNIVDYGALADGVTDNAPAIKKAVDACVKSGGGKVVIPGDGVFFNRAI